MSTWVLKLLVLLLNINLYHDHKKILMKTSIGIKWGLIFGVVIGLIVAGIIYSVVYAPRMPTLQKEVYNLTLNETNGNVTKATLAEKELPTVLPITIVLLNGISYALGGAIGGIIIAYMWEKNNSWIVKGLIGGVVILVLSLFLSVLPLIENIPTSLIIGLLISYKLHAINRKV